MQVVYYYQASKQEWRASSPAWAFPATPNKTLAQHRAEIERMGYPCVYGNTEIGPPEGPPQ